ncbi:hypothetical protein HYH03_000039 [Edaphochlamys debaryana]|uniref:Uncharacterized protein n=1 Tax=Edaphochlamys debaryana TaxID=47281 RepID=A0A835YGU0_9CHLO|nr:hypothetical protein HYH03_000039 [Edaphochlamys debaryana]|eukprot:KAG2501532.1 hypothetical protein HYH03_000039 [Edaphochlamys debaryana]
MDTPDLPAIPGWPPPGRLPGGSPPPPFAPTPPFPPTPDQHGDSGTIPLSPLAVALAAVVLVINGIISLRFKLGLHTQLLVAATRMVIQLSVLGYVLVPIFTYDRWWLVLLYGCFMLSVASLEAVQRPSYTFQGMLATALLAMASSSGLLITYTVAVVLALRPVWDAQYLIPLLGMLMGNATSAISVGLTTVLDDLAANRPVIEHLLALGANRFEATDAAVRRALRVSMTPLLNQMSVMGVVSIPGMMTGQILAGGDPAQAARYQMVIMFVIGGSTCLASVISIYLAALSIVDATHTFQGDKLIRKAKAEGGLRQRASAALAAARAHLATAQRKGRGLGMCLATACCCCLLPQGPAAAAARRRSSALVQRGSEGARGGYAGSSHAGPKSSASGVPYSDAGREPGTPWGQGGGGTSTSAPSPFAPASSRRGGGWVPALQSWIGVRAGPGPGAGGGGGGGGGQSFQPMSQERLLSSDSFSSSLLQGGPGGGVFSPVSPGALAAAANAGPQSYAYGGPYRLPGAGEGAGEEDEADRSGRGGVAFRGGMGGAGGRGGADLEGGAAGGLSGSAGAGGQGLAQPLLGGPTGGAGGGGGGAGEGGGMLHSGMAAVVSVGGWLGSRAVAGASAAWESYGRWRGTSGGGGGGGGGYRPM